MSSLHHPHHRALSLRPSVVRLLRAHVFVFEIVRAPDALTHAPHAVGSSFPGAVLKSHLRRARCLNPTVYPLLLSFSDGCNIHSQSRHTPLPFSSVSVRGLVFRQSPTSAITMPRAPRTVHAEKRRGVRRDWLALEFVVWPPTRLPQLAKRVALRFNEHHSMWVVDR